MVVPWLWGLVTGVPYRCCNCCTYELPYSPTFFAHLCQLCHDFESSCASGAKGARWHNWHSSFVLVQVLVFLVDRPHPLEVIDDLIRHRL